jgi:hypothetical protein
VDRFRSPRTWSAISWIFCSVSSSVASAFEVRSAARRSRQVGLRLIRSLRVERLNNLTSRHSLGASHDMADPRGVPAISRLKHRTVLMAKNAACISFGTWVLARHSGTHKMMPKRLAPPDARLRSQARLAAEE